MDDIFHQPDEFLDDNYPHEPEEAADWEPTREAAAAYELYGDADLDDAHTLEVVNWWMGAEK